MDKKNLFKVYFPTFLSGALYILLAYFTARTQFVQLFTLITAGFCLYLFLCRQAFSFKTGLVMALLLRFTFILALPSLSDDYFRFYWDGTLVLSGENPYLQLPSYYLESNHALPGLPATLYAQLNSPTYYSVYPPVCQYIFAGAKLLAQNNIYIYCLVLRLLIIIAEATTILLLRRILLFLHLPERQLWLYAFNPLVTLELTGNLHFEAFLLLTLLASIYFLLQNKTLAAAVAFGLAVSIKLLPLLFLPPLIKYFGWKKFMLFTGLMTGTIAISFIPFVSEALIRNIADSINLYFQKFEFNASIYYLLRSIGYVISGYNLIGVLGPLLGLTVLGSVLYLTKKFNHSNSGLIKIFLLSLSVYFFLATVVHPWYLCTVVALAALANWKYPLVWSWVAFLSYNAYRTTSYQENLYLVALEYSLVFGTLYYELFQQNKLSNAWKETT